LNSTEPNLIYEILAGDAEAYAILVRRYQKPIFNLMLRMTSSDEDALDLTQETFVRAYEKLEQFKTSSPFFPWLYTIGMNLARDFQRKAKASRTALEALSWDPDPRSNPGENLHETAEAQKVRQLLQTLPPDYREALILRFHEGLSVTELASAIGTSVSGAKMRIHRGLLKLRELLGGETHDA
jgi:RNA polymerase sigma-70 factor (ECF subfamily)